MRDLLVQHIYLCLRDVDVVFEWVVQGSYVLRGVANYTESDTVTQVDKGDL